jgi:hypothetical protein
MYLKLPGIAQYTMLDIKMSNQKRATKDQKPAARKLATRPATRNQLLETGNLQPEKNKQSENQRRKTRNNKSATKN